MSFDLEHAKVRKQAAENAGEWRAEGRSVYDSACAEMAHALTPRIATYIAAIHNTWLMLSNAWLLTSRKLRDRASLDRKS